MVAHEVSHQWLGNLVTLRRWGQAWLNEGLATFFSYLGADHVDPASHAWGRCLVDVTQAAFRTDSDRTRAWPLTDEVNLLSCLILSNLV